MCGEVVRMGKVDAVGRDRWEIDEAAKEECLMHRWSWDQLDIEILSRFLRPCGECGFVVCDHNQAVTITGY